jgi:hypothetical protein
MKALTRAAFFASLMFVISACSGSGTIPAVTSTTAQPFDSGGGMTGDHLRRHPGPRDSGGGMTGDDSGGGMTGDSRAPSRSIRPPHRPR